MRIIGVFFFGLFFWGGASFGEGLNCGVNEVAV